MDAICDLFPATSMRPRGPAARAWQLPFLNGIGDDDIKNYTSDQIQRILMQRAVVSIFLFLKVHSGKLALSAYANRR
jgi:hypothetical protein